MCAEERKTSAPANELVSGNSIRPSAETLPFKDVTGMKRDSEEFS
jgi:hypothetical protein